MVKEVKVRPSVLSELPPTIWLVPLQSKSNSMERGVSDAGSTAAFRVWLLMLLK